MEVQRVEKLDSGVGRVHRHVGRSVDQRRRVVEDDLHPGREEIGRDLCGLGRHGEHAHDDAPVWTISSSAANG